jgi:hypothetical protein
LLTKADEIEIGCQAAPDRIRDGSAGRPDLPRFVKVEIDVEG